MAVDELAPGISREGSDSTSAPLWRIEVPEHLTRTERLLLQLSLWIVETESRRDHIVAPRAPSRLPRRSSLSG